MKDSQSLPDRINDMLSDFPAMKVLKIFPVILIFLTLFATYRIFTIPNPEIKPQPLYNAYSITNKDFGKTITVHTGDTIVISLTFQDTNPHATTIQPAGILKQIQWVGNDLTFTAEKSGHAILTITSRPVCKLGSVCPQIILVNFKLGVIVL